MRKSLIYITSLLLVSIIVLIVFYIQRVKVAEMNIYPGELLESYRVLPDGTKNWKVNTIQPIVLGYRSIGNANYMIVLNRNDKGWYSALVFLTGEINERTNDKMMVIDKEGGPQVLNYSQIKQRFRWGDRIRLEYLDTPLISGFKPSEEFCAKYMPACLYFEFGEVKHTISSSLQSLLWKPPDSYGAMSLYENLRTEKSK